MVAQVRLVGAIHTVAVFDVFAIEIKNDHGKHIAQLESFGEGDLHQRLFRPFFKEDQCTGGGMTREDGEIDATGNRCSRLKDDGRPARSRNSSCRCVG